MVTSTNTNNAALAPRDGAKRSASMTTMKTTKNTTTATKTMLKGGAKQAANPATTKTNKNTTAIETVPKGQPNKGRNAVARQKMNQSRKSNNTKKQVIKSVHVNQDVDDNHIEGNNNGNNNNNCDKNGDDDDDGDNDNGSGSGNSSGSGKGEGSSSVSEYDDVVECVGKDNDRWQGR